MGAMTFVGKGDRPPLTVAVPPLFSEHTVDEVLDWFGGWSDSKVLCDGEWVVLPEVVLCLTRVGTDAESTGFVSCTDFRWCAERAYEAAPGQKFPSIPLEARASTATKPLLLFVKAQHGPQYVFVGEMEPSGSYGSLGGHGGAILDLVSMLPVSVWRRLGGAPDPGVTDAELDSALLNLSMDLSTDRLKEAAETVVAYWNGPNQAKSGLNPMDVADIEMPETLRWWITKYGETRVLCCPNYILPLEWIRERTIKSDVEEGNMLFALESQGCWCYSTTSTGDDPPVRIAGDFSDEKWLPAEDRLTVFLGKAMLLDGIRHAPYGAMGRVSPSELDRLLTRMPRLPLRDWRYWETKAFCGCEGAYAIVSGEFGDATWDIDIGAMSEEPLQFLHEFENIDWYRPRF